MVSCSDSEGDRRDVEARPDERQMMRVGIAGAGAIGRSVAQELLDYGHKVLLIEHTSTTTSRTPFLTPSGCWPMHANWPR